MTEAEEVAASLFGAYCSHLTTFNFPSSTLDEARNFVRQKVGEGAVMTDNIAQALHLDSITYFRHYVAPRKTK